MAIAATAHTQIDGKEEKNEKNKKMMFIRNNKNVYVNEGMCQKKNMMLPISYLSF